MRTRIVILLILLAVAHQDFWWRTDSRTLVFGALPISLAYHIGVSIVASILWGLACAYCWPRNVDVCDEDAWTPPAGKERH